MPINFYRCGSAKSGQDEWGECYDARCQCGEDGERSLSETVREDIWCCTPPDTVCNGTGQGNDRLVVCPEGMREKEKGGNERDFSSCPGCEKVQIELEEDSEYGDSEEEDFEEDSCSNSSEEESSVGQTSVEECSEDVCSSGEDSE